MSVNGHFTETVIILSEGRPNLTTKWYYEDNNSKIIGYNVNEIINSDIPYGSFLVKEQPTPVTSISIDMEDAIIQKYGKLSLTATINPGSADSRVIWSSSNTYIATVDQNGNVKGVNKGLVKITATSVEDPLINAVCYVYVIGYEHDVPVSNIVLSNTQLSVIPGTSMKIQGYANPMSASNTEIIWKSSDDSVVQIDENGNIIANKLGTVTLTAISVWNPFITAECIVTVEHGSSSATEITLDSNEVSLDVGGTKKLTATVTPQNASNRDVVWESSNEAIAVVDTNGNVVALSAGVAIIFAKTSDGSKVATCIVTVEGSGSTTTDVLVMNQNILTLTVGGSNVLVASLSSGSLEGKTIRWSSSNSAIAMVDSNGIVTATGKGTATITATLMSSQGMGITSAACMVTVEDKSGETEESTVKTEIVNGVNGQIVETTVKPSISRDSARVSSSNVDSIVSQIEEAKKRSFIRDQS